MTGIKQVKWKGYAAFGLGLLFPAPLVWGWITLATEAIQGQFPHRSEGLAQILRLVFVGYFGLVAYKHLGPPSVGNTLIGRAGWGRNILRFIDNRCRIAQKILYNAQRRQICAIE